MHTDNTTHRTAPRYEGIDILKAICAFFVVMIHLEPPQNVQILCQSPMKLAVPVFFIITGFFYSDTVAKGRTGAQLRKISLLLCFCAILFPVYNTVIFLLAKIVAGNSGLERYLHSLIDWREWVDLLVVNDTNFIYGHLWYLVAVLYVLFLAPLLYKLPSKCHAGIALVLLMLNLALGRYSRLIFGLPFPEIYVRNFLFTGIPFFCCGLWIRTQYRQGRLPPAKTLLLAAVALLILSLGESIVTETILLRIRSAGNLLLTTVFLAPVVFCLFVQAYHGRSARRPENVLAVIGRKYSVYIYIFHPIVIELFIHARNYLPIPKSFGFFEPFAVCLISLLVAIIFEFAHNWAVSKITNPRS